MSDSNLNAQELRSLIVQLCATLRGIELQLQKVADNTDQLRDMSSSLEAFMGGWQPEGQYMGSFQEFLRCYQKAETLEHFDN